MIQANSIPSAGGQISEIPVSHTGVTTQSGILGIMTTSIRQSLNPTPNITSNLTPDAEAEGTNYRYGDTYETARIFKGTVGAGQTLTANVVPGNGGSLYIAWLNFDLET